MRRRLWRRVGLPLAAGLLLVAAGVQWVRAGADLTLAHSAFVLVALAFVFAGELARVRSSDRLLAPVSTASAMGLVLAPIGPAGHGLRLSEAVMSIGLVCLAALTARALAGLGIGLVDTASRLIGVSLSAALARVPIRGHDLFGWWHTAQWATWLAAAVVALVALAGVVVELGLWTATRDRTWRIPFLTLAREDLARSGAVGAIMINAGALIAVCAPAVGALAVPLFLWPIALAVVGLRRTRRLEVMNSQLTTAFGRLTEETGHTVHGHARRVSRLSVRVGEELGLGPAELATVQSAALVHDVGQVTLPEPIPDGATLLAAPAEQAWVAQESEAIARRAGIATEVLHALHGSQAHFRQMREYGEAIPITGRILKVVNAYDDLTHGRPSSRGRALERIHLGLGYDYDPAVVDALTRVTEPAQRRRP